jgi:hypothetical protein
MHMQRRLSTIERDITAHPDHFVLTVDENLLVHVSLGIEKSQPCSTQGSDSGEMGTGNLILPGKFYEAGNPDQYQKTKNFCECFRGLILGLIAFTDSLLLLVECRLKKF